ncbi:MAG: glycosyltransferase family 2 protein [Geminicoccaceae bacterium]
MSTPALFRALKLAVRGDLVKARGVLDEAYVRWRLPPPALPRLEEVQAQYVRTLEKPRPLAEPVDIVIPIHNGGQHLARLFATLFDRTDPKHRFLLMDDASSEPTALALLRDAATRPNVVLVREEVNRGFVATVNRAMTMAAGHAVLLNTDTEVPPAWLERLMRPIFGEPKVASTTPFSNSASAFSFPVPDTVNPMPEGVGVAEIDAAFQRLSPAHDPSLLAPAGVGFCMGVNLAAWRALGPFDAATFGHGYGEETDWCLRAGAAGWRNVLVPDLFVYHADGGSFGSAAKRAIVEGNLRLIYRRWPAYRRQLATHHRLDPWASRRAAAVLALAAAPGGSMGSGVRVTETDELGHVVIEARCGAWWASITAKGGDARSIAADARSLAWP